MNNNNEQPVRRLDSIKILDLSSERANEYYNIRCSNCRERHYLITRPDDNYFLFCTNCGQRTALRSIKRERGLAAPAIQEKTVAVQSTHLKKAKDRRPRGLKVKNTALEEYLLSKGFTVVDVQYNEPNASDS